MVSPTRGEDNPHPHLVVLNEDLAVELGFDPQWLRTPAGIDFLCARGTEPAHAQRYAGFQFGQFNPQMGDGRAALLGEVETPHGLMDLHAKGIGRTPLSKPGADGRGTLRSMLREYLFAESLHSLGVPTTRSLAVLSTGREVIRHQGPEPAGIHVRVAHSHIRVGSFHLAAIEDTTQQLADYTIARHFPGMNYLEFFASALHLQCQTIAHWQSLGFLHGVMNTDNMVLSGQTIDFGPCAFVNNPERDKDVWFSSIDTHGRYRFGHQPQMMAWNFARLAESILPLLGTTPQQAQEFALGILDTWEENFDDALAHIPQRNPSDLVLPRPQLVEPALEDLDTFHGLLNAIKKQEKSAKEFISLADLSQYRTFCGT